MLADQLDLRDILSFQPKGGVIRFLGRRAVVAPGLLRKELIDTFGLFAARGILTRLGYAYGRCIAEALREEHPDPWAEGKAGPWSRSSHRHWRKVQRKPGAGPMQSRKNAQSQIVGAESVLDGAETLDAFSLEVQ